MSSEEVIKGPNILETAGWGQNSEKEKFGDALNQVEKESMKELKNKSEIFKGKKNYLNKTEIMNFEEFSLPLL